MSQPYSSLVFAQICTYFGTWIGSPDMTVIKNLKSVKGSDYVQVILLSSQLIKQGAVNTIFAPPASISMSVNFSWLLYFE